MFDKIQKAIQHLKGHSNLIVLPHLNVMPVP